MYRVLKAYVKGNDGEKIKKARIYEFDYLFLIVVECHKSCNSIENKKDNCLYHNLELDSHLFRDSVSIVVIPCKLGTDCGDPVHPYEHT